MNTRSVILTAAFLGIVGLISFSIYSGIIEIKKPQNLLGLVGIGDSDGFEFVGSVDLEDNSSTQNDDYFFENNKKNNKKEISAPTKTKKAKEPSRTIVKVISGAVVKPNNDTVSSSVIVSATTPIVSSTPLLALPVIITTSSVENSAPIQIQETQENNPEKAQEQNLAQPPQIIQEIIQEPASEQPQTQNNTPQIQENVLNNILISEVMAGADGNSSYEFIELFNPTANPIDLTGWSIKKKSSTGSESTLVTTSRLEGKIIPSNKYFLLANEGGYSSASSPQVDVFWPKSYTLAYTNNAIVIYNSNGELVEEVSWTEIPKDQSIERESFSNNQFKIQSNPNPRNSDSN